MELGVHSIKREQKVLNYLHGLKGVQTESTISDALEMSETELNIVLDDLWASKFVYVCGTYHWQLTQEGMEYCDDAFPRYKSKPQFSVGDVVQPVYNDIYKWQHATIHKRMRDVLEPEIWAYYVVAFEGQNYLWYKEPSLKIASNPPID